MWSYDYLQSYNAIKNVNNQYIDQYLLHWPTFEKKTNKVIKNPFRKKKEESFVVIFQNKLLSYLQN